jgi:hypothetical protein
MNYRNRQNNNGHRAEVSILAALAVIAVLCAFYIPTGGCT